LEIKRLGRKDLIVFFCRISSLLDCADRKHGWVLENLFTHLRNIMILAEPVPTQPTTPTLNRYQE
jgi:hypothetical protein